MKELEELDKWLTDRISEYEVQAEKYRLADHWNTLTVCNQKRYECLTVLLHVRLMIEEGAK